MGIFASKTPRDLNPHGVIMTGAGTLPLCLCGWQRRRLDGPTLAEHIAEFDHVQHNEPNPILVELRCHVELGADMRGQVQVFLNTEPAQWYKHFGVTMRQINHARKVLARLAALS